MKVFVSLEEVKDHLNDESYVFADCRFNLANKEEGQNVYEESHLPGAVFFDLEKDLSSPVTVHGGRHPLPQVELLAKKLGEAGIDETKTVIAYDDQNGCMAARLWWLLKYYGHGKVFVLDENYSVWQDKGYPVTSDRPQPSPRTFVPHIKENWIIDHEAVKQRGEEEILIDARAPERFRGDVEPLDPKAGHIPGAENWFWMDNIKGGKWLSNQELEKRFQSLKEKLVLLYCGSGVTACANFLAMSGAGLTNLRLYPGSWSDWVSYDENPVETGDAKNQ